ncbi:MAG: PadR family transcriptional regulator [bacterium]|nr:PadR family transcriptional regulator [bacterium]
MVVLALKEEIILSALWMLGGSAHGSHVRNKVVELQKKDVVYGTLYNLMEVLIRKGFVTSKKDDPTPERGGKRKTIYTITDEGKKALKETILLHETIRNELPDIELGVSGQ